MLPCRHQLMWLDFSSGALVSTSTTGIFGTQLYHWYSPFNGQVASHSLRHHMSAREDQRHAQLLSRETISPWQVGISEMIQISARTDERNRQLNSPSKPRQYYISNTGGLEVRLIAHQYRASLFNLACMHSALQAEHHAPNRLRVRVGISKHDKHGSSTSLLSSNH
jgi:hypothetical protein